MIHKNFVYKGEAKIREEGRPVIHGIGLAITTELIFEGIFKDGYPAGKGRLFSNGIVYEGNFRSLTFDPAEHYVIRMLNNPNVYLARYVGLREWVGMCFFPDGSIEMGLFK